MNDRKAGVLVERHTGSGYIFRYDENYLASDCPAISVTMPELRVPLESEILFPKNIYKRQHIIIPAVVVYVVELIETIYRPWEVIPLQF